MDVLFALGNEATVEDIREKLTDPPSYSAVRAMLAKLEVKGTVRHREKGLRYVYSPTIARATARRSAQRNLLMTFFEGSPGQAVTALLKDEKWSEEELDHLVAEIEKARKDRRTS